MNPEPTIDAMRRAACALVSGDPCERVRAIQVAQDALDAAKAASLAEVEASKAYEADGASTLGTWVHNELRISTAQAAHLVRAAATFAALPLVAEAAAAGRIRTEHVAKFTYGLRHIGVDIMVDAQGWLLDVAQTNDPIKLFEVVRALRAAHFPEDLDNAYDRGMEKQDINVTSLPDGCSAAAMPLLRRLHTHWVPEPGGGGEVQGGAGLGVRAA